MAQRFPAQNGASRIPPGIRRQIGNVDKIRLDILNPRRKVMAQFPDAFGMSVTVEDMDAARRFYIDLYPHDHVSEGVFAGINYLSIMRNGETLVNIFQKGEGNPLAGVFPTLKVDSVATYEEKIKGLGGSVLIPSNICPCTGAPFAVCVDVSGNQFMIKQPRG
jgi:predicted enzyme related to lactoylglutathione lyase